MTDRPIISLGMRELYDYPRYKAGDVIAETDYKPIATGEFCEVFIDTRSGALIKMDGNRFLGLHKQSGG